MIEEKRVEDSRVETVHIIRPNHLNAAGRLFGGMLMQWLDEVAGMVAKRHTRANVITASVDNLRFIHGAYKGEMVVIVGKVTYVGTTSGSACRYLCGTYGRWDAPSHQPRVFYDGCVR